MARDGLRWSYSYGQHIDLQPPVAAAPDDREADATGARANAASPRFTQSRYVSKKRGAPKARLATMKRGRSAGVTDADARSHAQPRLAVPAELLEHGRPQRRRQRTPRRPPRGCAARQPASAAPRRAGVPRVHPFHEWAMRVQECPERAGVRVRGDEEQRQLRPSDGDRQLGREIPDRPFAGRLERELRQRSASVHAQAWTQCRHLVALAAEPRRCPGALNTASRTISRFSRAADHQAAAMPIVGLADGPIERLVMHVIDARRRLASRDRRSRCDRGRAARRNRA